MIRKALAIFLLAVTITVVSSQDNQTAPNCSNPLFSAEAFKARNQTRPRFLSSPGVSLLKNCKIFSNKTSCCNNETDSDIGVVFKRYKDVLSNLTSKKIRAIKKGFEDYAKIDFSDLPNGEKAKQKVSELVGSIQARLNETTKGAVACAKQALKLSAGLLCSGCNANWGRFVRNGSFVLAKNSCLALSNACYGLLKGFDSLANDTKADVSNLTDAITEFVGEDLPPTDEDLSGDLNQTRLLQAGSQPANVDKDFNQDAYCKKWVDSGAAASCAVCYLPDLPAAIPEGDDGTSFINKLREKSNDCLNNPLIKAAQDVYRNFYPNTGANKITFHALTLIKKFWENSNFAVLPAVIVLKNKITLNFLSGNNKVNNDWIALMNSKALQKIKEQRASELTSKIVENLKKITSAALTQAQNAADSAIVSREKFVESFNKAHLVCTLKAGDALRRELKKKLNEAFKIKVSLKDQSAGTVTGAGESAPKSRLPEFFKNCTNNTFSDKVESFALNSNGKGLNVVCLDTTCVVATDEVAEKAPAAKNKTEAVSNFDKLEKKGSDPKRVSENTGRKVPDQIDLPQEVDKVIKALYKAPCDNVTHCARWFCTKFLNGPFARVEKVLNPQDQSDELDGEASGAYTADLNSSNSSARILLAQNENEIADDGFNFIAVADNSALDSQVAVDGVSDAASGYDSSIQADNKIDPSIFDSNTNSSNSTSGNNNTNGTTKVNETKGGKYGSRGVIDSILVLLGLTMFLFF